MIWLTKHETEAAYNAVKDSLETPQVALTLDDMKIHLQPYVDPYNGHDFVEIGGLKWATMNVGAENITDYGMYFQWGDIQGYTASQVGSTSGKKPFKWDDYKYGNGSTSPGATGMTKYNATDELTTLDESDDAVRSAWGGKWRMPTKDEFVALGAAVNTAWTNDYQGSGIRGLVCTDKNDSSKVLFFPAGSKAWYGTLDNLGNYCYYWSKSLITNNMTNAYTFYTTSSSPNWQWTAVGRANGCTLRGVVG